MFSFENKLQTCQYKHYFSCPDNNNNNNNKTVCLFYLRSSHPIELIKWFTYLLYFAVLCSLCCPLAVNKAVERRAGWYRVQHTKQTWLISRYALCWHALWGVPYRSVVLAPGPNTCSLYTPLTNSIVLRLPFRDAQDTDLSYAPCRHLFCRSRPLAERFESIDNNDWAHRRQKREFLVVVCADYRDLERVVMESSCRLSDNSMCNERPFTVNVYETIELVYVDGWNVCDA